MKKGLLIVMTVAILGGLGLYVNKNGSNASTSSLVAPKSTTSGSADLTNAGGNTSSTQAASSSGSATYKDGTYDGSSDTPYGNVSIAVVISGGKISDVQYLQMPNDQGHSQEVTNFSEPLLKQEAIQKQSPKIEFVTGATSTSLGFEESMQQALNQAAQA